MQYVVCYIVYTVQVLRSFFFSAAICYQVYSLQVEHFTSHLCESSSTYYYQVLALFNCSYTMFEYLQVKITTLVHVAGRPGSSEVPRNPLTRWDVSSTPANGIFLTKKQKNRNKNAQQRVEND